MPSSSKTIQEGMTVREIATRFPGTLPGLEFLGFGESFGNLLIEVAAAKVGLQFDEVLDVLNELASESDSTGTETDEEIRRREEKFWSPV